jgi:adenylate cyclase
MHLVSVEGNERFDLTQGRVYVVGRGEASDIPLYDPTISRRHAELSIHEDEVTITDLESSNGTFVNGEKIHQTKLQPGDSVCFGKVVCQLRAEDTPGTEPAPGGASPASGGTIVRQVAVHGGVETALPDLEEGQSGPGLLRVEGKTDEERLAKKMALLLDVSQKLASEFEPANLLESVVDMTFDVMNVDRVSVLLSDPSTGELVPRVSKSRLGDGKLRHVPRSIAQKAVEERVAIMTDNASADTRFQGKSVVMQSVRSAMCTPLMASAEEVLGILYVDSLTATEAFSDEDLQFLIGFSGIVAATLHRLRDSERMRREAVVRSNFERYFAPNVAAQIAQQQEGARPVGEKRPITILFSDIRGFTTMSESMTPDAIAQLLSEYFTEMVEVIFEHGGTLDKFVGDAILALWGAPIAHDDDADGAMRAASDMQRSIEALNAKWAAAGRPTIGVGIGINYGEVFAGNIGSQRRLEYTVIGDAVNVASRLCTQAGAGEILLTEPFYQRLTTSLEVERIDAMPLKGRAQPIAIYRVKR